MCFDRTLLYSSLNQTFIHFSNSTRCHPSIHSIVFTIHVITVDCAVAQKVKSHSPPLPAAA